MARHPARLTDWLHRPPWCVASALVRRGCGSNALWIYSPSTAGLSRLVDGTILQVAAEKTASGDPTTSGINIRGHRVSVDAIGVVAVRRDEKGRMQAFAAGGLKRVKSGEFEVSLDERRDVALWIADDGEWQSALQGDGPLPEPLARLTRRWTRLSVPSPPEEK